MNEPETPSADSDQVSTGSDPVPPGAEARLELFKKRFDYVSKKLPGISVDAETYGQLLNMNRANRRANVARMMKAARRHGSK